MTISEIKLNTDCWRNLEINSGESQKKSSGRPPGWKYDEISVEVSPGIFSENSPGNLPGVSYNFPSGVPSREFSQNS